jgi:hypothetical protein
MAETKIISRLDAIEKRVVELVAQNAELIEALKLAVSKYEEDRDLAPDFNTSMWATPEWVEIAKSAIEKAEKK